MQLQWASGGVEICLWPFHHRGSTAALGVFNKFDNCVTFISWKDCLWFLNRLAQGCSSCHGHLVVRLVCVLSSGPPDVEFVHSLYFLTKSKHNKLPLNLNVWVDRVFAPGWTAELSRVPSRLSPGDCWDRLQGHGNPQNLCSVTQSSCKQ